MFERFLNTLLDIGSSTYYVRKIPRKLTFVTYVCVLGGKKCCFFGKFCVRTKWIISNLYQFLKCFIWCLCVFLHLIPVKYTFIYGPSEKWIALQWVLENLLTQIYDCIWSLYSEFFWSVFSPNGEIRARKSPNKHTSRTDGYSYTSMITLNRKYYWSETSIVFLLYLFFESSG